MYRYCQKLNDFWHRHVALFYATVILVTIYAIFNFSFVITFPLFVLFVPVIYFKQYKRFFFALVSALIVIVGIKTYYLFPNLPSDGILGNALFKINSVQAKQSFFGKTILYKGTIKHFEVAGKKVARNIPCSIYASPKLQRHDTNYIYKIEGTLKESRNYHFVLKINKKTKWTPIKKSFSLAQWRFQLKAKVKKYIHKNISNNRTADFLSGLATGEFNNYITFFTFHKLGLLHIMAISGFHFAIIAAFLGLFLSFFLSPKNNALVLIIILTGYFLFIGNGISIMRAWICISIALLGIIIEKKPIALNTLGCAAIIIAIINPLDTLSMGFQLSFLVTASILLLYKPIENVLINIFPKYSLEQLLNMNALNRHVSILFSITRSLLTLSISVHLVTLPIVLSTFHKFPYFSFIYNLFFPFLISFSILLLLLGTAFFFITPISTIIHYCNNLYTSAVLNITEEIPNTLNFIIRSQGINSFYLIIYITAIFTIGIVQSSHDEYVKISL